VTKSTSREYAGCLISWASRLDTDAGLAPVTSLGVVSEEASVSLRVLHIRARFAWLALDMDEWNVRYFFRVFVRGSSRRVC